MALGLWASAGTRWMTPVQPWFAGSGGLWLAFDDSDTARQLHTGRVTADVAPWRTRDERDAGHRRAATWLTELLA